MFQPKAASECVGKWVWIAVAGRKAGTPGFPSQLDKYPIHSVCVEKGDQYQHSGNLLSGSLLEVRQTILSGVMFLIAYDLIKVKEAGIYQIRGRRRRERVLICRSKVHCLHFSGSFLLYFAASTLRFFCSMRCSIRKKDSFQQCQLTLHV